jgi:hypothetical protein
VNSASPIKREKTWIKPSLTPNTRVHPKKVAPNQSVSIPAMIQKPTSNSAESTFQSQQDATSDATIASENTIAPTRTAQALQANF